MCLCGESSAWLQIEWSNSFCNNIKKWTWICEAFDASNKSTNDHIRHYMSQNVAEQIRICGVVEKGFTLDCDYDHLYWLLFLKVFDIQFFV